MTDKNKELILCISKRAVKDVMDKSGMTLADAVLRAVTVPGMASVLPRGDVETDEELLQPIPYVTVIAGGADDEPAILVYRRSAKGGEKRLEDKYSIGFGGHVNIDDLYAYYVNPDAESVMNVCFGRELAEELGMPDNLECNILRNNVAIYDETEAVSRVHVGISYFLFVEKKPEFSTEDTVDNVEWAKLEDILPGGKFYDKLETWSRAISTQLSELLVAKAE